MHQDETLKGKIALITGASRGIGRASALALAKAGCDIAVNYVHAEAEAESVAAWVRQEGRRACVVQADVSRPEGIQHLIASIEQHLGAIDILVNNAGIN